MYYTSKRKINLLSVVKEKRKRRKVREDYTDKALKSSY